MDHKDLLRKAQAGIALDAVFWAQKTLSLEYVVDEESQALAWTDGKKLGYNPTTFAELTLDEAKGLIAHEVWHCLAGHNLRRGDRDPGLWNVACDHETNHVVNKAGFILPKGALHGMEGHAEGIYAMLDQARKDMEKQQQQQQQQQQEKGQDQQDQGQGDNQPEEDDQPNDGNGGQGQGQGQDDQQGEQEAPGGQGGGQSPDVGNMTGSGSGKGDPTANSDPNRMGEVRDLPGENGGKASEAEIARADAERKVELSQAAQLAQGAGKLPGHLKRLVEGLLEKKMDWTEHLSRFVNRVAKNDYSWSKPSRRHIAAGLYLPGMDGMDLGSILVAIDTSGSVSDRVLQEFAGGLEQLLDQFDAELQVVCCDTDVRHHEVITRQDLPIRLEPHGGGGTDFRPPFTWAEDNLLDEPVCMVYLTDGDCSRFPAEPPYPVLWVVSGSSYQVEHFTPPFGEVVGLRG